MKQKLDHQSKIILSTAAINWLAASVQQCAFTTHTTSSDMHYHFLGEIQEKLSIIYEQMANYCNANDIITPIDIRVLNPISDILIFGKDDTEE